MHEPGLVATIEQPSLLPRAVELLEQEGIGETQLVAQCRVPLSLFRTVTSRAPGSVIHESGQADDKDQPSWVSIVDGATRP